MASPSALKWLGKFVRGPARITTATSSRTTWWHRVGLLGLMTSVLMTPDARRTVESGSAHGNRHPPLPHAPAGQGDLDEPDRVDSARPAGRDAASRWYARGDEVGAEDLERVCIENCRKRKMNHDLPC